jgi:predicted DCC family thiol-disulfide oxidoreductase YuxK
MLLVFYDNYCPLCLKTKSLLERVDWFHQLSFLGIRDRDVFKNYPKLDNEESLKRIATSDGEQIIYGFESVFRIIRKMPQLWLFAPFFLLLRWTNLGAWFYDEIALRRKILPFSCDENCEITHTSK